MQNQVNIEKHWRKVNFKMKKWCQQQLRPLDDLGTAGDQFIITEEEADEKRRQRQLKIS